MKSVQSKQKDFQKNISGPLSLKDFAVRFVAIPGIFLLVPIVFAVLTSRESSIYLGAAIVYGLIILLLLYAAYIAVAVATVLGVWYTFRRAHNNWRYYLLLTILPLLVFLWQGLPIIILYVQEHSPDGVRYTQNKELCDEIYEFDYQSEKLSTDNLSQYPKIALDKYTKDIEDTNKQYNNISKNTKLVYQPACSDWLLTTEELSQIKSFSTEKKLAAASKDKTIGKLNIYKQIERLQRVDELEKTKNVEEAYTQATKEGVDWVNPWQLFTSCYDENMCDLVWINQENSEEEKSTKELLTIFNQATAD